MITTAKTAREYDFGPGLRLEERIDTAEVDGIEARWEFGHWMLEHIPEGKRKLPAGFLDGLTEVTGKSRAELKTRRQFAEAHPTREALATAVANHSSWTSIRDALGSRNGRDPGAGTAGDDWETPQDLFDELDREFGGFELDVCASLENAKCERFYTPEQDGLDLDQEWRGTCWCNPPYSNIAPWMERARRSAGAGATVVCLVPAWTDTGWWWDNCRSAEVRFVRGRLKFGGSENSAPFPSAVIIFGPGRKPGVKWWDRNGQGAG